jgi:hypothetical protein
MSDLDRLSKEYLEDEAYGKNEGRSMEIEISRQYRERKEKAVIEIHKAVEEKAIIKIQKAKEEEEDEEEVRLPLEMVPHISYAIVNVFENYYQDELKDFQEGVEEEWTEEIFKRKFENHMVYSLLTMRFGEEEARNEMKGLWDHQCKVWEYNSD